MTRKREESSGGGDPKARGKLPGFTQACGNRRFARSERFKKWRGGKGPERPDEAVRGDPCVGNGETSGLAGLD